MRAASAGAGEQRRPAVHAPALLQQQHMPVAAAGHCVHGACNGMPPVPSSCATPHVSCSAVFTD